MEEDLRNTIKKTTKHWWISLLVGLVSIGLGVWCFASLGTTFLALTFVFIVGFFANGIFEITFALANRKQHDGWGWTLAIGIVDLIFGIILLANPEIAPAILAYFIGFWLMFQSFWGIGVSMDLQKYKRSGWGWLLALAIIGLLLSIVLLAQPIITGVLAASFTASIFVIYGIFRIILAVRLKNLDKYI